MINRYSIHTQAFNALIDEIYETFTRRFFSLNKDELHLQETLNKINFTLEHIAKVNEFNKKTLDSLKTYLQENTGKIADDEVFKIFSQTNNLFSHYEDGLKEEKKLLKAKNSPYFGSITYEDGFGKDTTYIGLRDIVDPNGISIVSDWRAPISSLFYDSNLGKTSYSTDDKTFEVDLKDKKQISIKNGKLIYSYSTDEKINDDILLNVLINQKSSTEMKNIVSSIQKEQNEILRQPSFYSIIINGIAGSGKTSIAMHRLAYLLYSDKKNIKNENILIISPNELFSRYIGSLLPELGEDNVATVSFRILISEDFNNAIKFETRSELLEDIFISNPDRLKIVQRKFSEDYANELFKFLSKVNVVDIVKTVYFNKKYYYLDTLPNKYSLSDENNFRIYRKIEFILDELMDEHFFEQKNENGKKDSSLNGETKIPLGDEKRTQLRDERREQLKDDYKAQIREEFKAQILEKLEKENLFKKFIRHYEKFSRNKTVKYDDIPTFAFINFSIKGFKVKPNIKEIFIDEIQDYDAVSLKILKEMFPNAKFVIVGDIKQNLISENNNISYMQKLLPFSKSYNLATCYRSTIEISTLANALINYSYNGKLLRHGNKPKLFLSDDLISTIKDIEKTIHQDEQLAIICKTKHEALNIHNLLPNFALINNESVRQEDLKNNKIITTIHLSKGLEFDNVIIPNVNKENFQTNIEKQLLYIMITRALHNVNLILKSDDSSIFLNKEFSTLLDVVK